MTRTRTLLLLLFVGAASTWLSGCCCPIVCDPIGDLIGIDPAQAAAASAQAREAVPSPAAPPASSVRY